MSPAMLTSKEGINKNMISLFYLCVLVCTNDKQMLPVCIPIRQHLEACIFFYDHKYLRIMVQIVQSNPIGLFTPKNV